MSRVKYILAFFCCISAILFVVPSHVFAQRVSILNLIHTLKNHPQDDIVKADLLNLIASSSYLIKINDMLDYSDQALSLSKKLNYQKGEATAYLIQGDFYTLKNGDPVALERFDHALLLYRKIHNDDGICHTYNSIGFYYTTLKQYTLALNSYMQGKKALSNKVKSGLKLEIEGNIGESYLRLHNFKQADDYSNSMLELSVKARDTNMIAKAFSNLANINFALGNHIIALDYANKGFGLMRKSKNVSFYTIAELNLVAAEVYIDLRSFDKAKYYLQRALNISANLNYAPLFSEVLMNFYRLDSIGGNYKQALNYFLSSKKIEDSLANASRNQQLSIFKIKYETEKNIAENRVLRAEEESNKKVISQQQGTLMMLAAGMALIIFMVIYLQFANKTILNKNEIIKEQNTNLEHINVVKDKLFSVVSHDLRGPLLQMKGLLNLFETHDVNDHEMRELTPTVQENLDKTLELVDNLLIWSKNQMQGFTLKPAQFDLCQLVSENVQNFKNQAQQKKLVLMNEIEPKLFVFADREMINIVLRNLISNAVKFTPESGMIRVFSKRTERQITISVDDTGVGVKKEVLERIFAFVNLSTPGTLNEKGSGVGLKLCKDFVELNKGNIWIERKDSDGSVFSFSLPVFHTLN